MWDSGVRHSLDKREGAGSILTEAFIWGFDQIDLYQSKIITRLPFSKPPCNVNTLLTVVCITCSTHTTMSTKYYLCTMYITMYTGIYNLSSPNFLLYRPNFCRFLLYLLLAHQDIAADYLIKIQYLPIFLIPNRFNSIGFRFSHPIPICQVEFIGNRKFASFWRDR